MSISTGATDVVGGYPAAYAGGLGAGIGGLGLVGLIGLNSFLGNRFGEFGAGAPGAVAGTTVLEQNVSELRKDVAGVNTTVEALGNELQGALAMQNLSQQTEFRSLDNRLCDSEKSALTAAFQATIQGMQNTQMLSNQLTAFQVSNDKEFCSIKSAINADGDATRALITQNLIDGLRSELATERRNRDNREIEINVSQTNQQTQNQLQAQLQSQNQFLATMFNSLGDQVNRAANSVVNVGSGTVAGGQSNNQANTKVNS